MTGAEPPLDHYLNIVFKRDNMTPNQYTNLYQACYQYCNSINASEANAPVNQRSKELYYSLQKYVVNHAQLIVNKSIDLTGEALLKYYCDEWDNFRFSSKNLDGIFSYLNRHWIRREIDEGSLGVYNVYYMALQVWKTTVFDQLETKLRWALLEEIRKSRTGDSIVDRYISTTIESMIEIGLDKIETKGVTALAKPLHIYKDSFEVFFLQETEAFYSNEVRQFLLDGGEQPDCKEYMEKVWQRITQEENRVKLLLNSSTMQGLQDVINQVMITCMLEFIISHFGPLLVEQEKADADMARMYNLCCRVPSGLDALREALQAHVTKEGHVALEQRVQEAFQDPKIYVNTILEVHERYQELVYAAFQKEPGFMKSLDSAAIAFINMNAVVKKAPANQHGLKSAELIARYCDGLMRKNSEMLDEMEMEDLQRKIITIFKYLEDKEVFLKFYTEHFCKRLINELSVSDEAELTFINKLTDCCGFEFTSRLMKMTQDCQVSKDLTEGYMDAATGDAKKMEFAVQVLYTRTWPSFPQTSLTLPMNLVTTIEDFTEFYNGKYNGRRLQWVYAQCRGELSSTAFGKREYIFGVTTTQMCTLLLFNEQTSYVAKQIMSGTGMDTKTTSAVVGSLVKNQVLTSDQQSGEQTEVPMNAVITLNTAYANEKVRVDLSKMIKDVEDGFFF